VSSRKRINIPSPRPTAVREIQLTDRRLRARLLVAKLKEKILEGFVRMLMVVWLKAPMQS